MDNLLEARADTGIGDGKEDQIESLRPIESMSEKVISDLNKRKFCTSGYLKMHSSSLYYS